MKQQLIIIIILLAIGATFGYMFVWPNYQRWTSKNNELKAITAELSELEAKESFIKELEAAEPTLSLQSDQSLAFIPVQEEREQFAAELDALAQANNLSLSTLTFAAASTKKAAASSDDDDETEKTTPATTKKTTKAPSGPSPVLSYNAAVSGSFSSIEKFLKQLEQTKRYTTVGTFDVSTGGKATTETADASPTEPTLTLTLTGSIYTKPLNTKFDKKQKFSTDLWQYLLDRTKPIESSGANNPFAPF